jgi:hypothetical protein
MKWIERTAVIGKQRYTALVTDDAQERELGRYLHQPDGTFLPVGTHNNARPRRTQFEAKRFVLEQCLKRLKDEMGEVGLLWGQLPPPSAQSATSAVHSEFSESTGKTESQK